MGGRSLTGLNFPFYQEGVHVTAVEPSEAMLRLSKERAAQAAASITLLKGDAGKLELEAERFDNVVGTLVLCTVPDPVRAVREMLRVCKPGGTFLLFEHVRLNHKLLGPVQDLLTPLWKRLCDGCCLNRDTPAVLRSEGLDLLEIKPYLNDIFLAIRARKP